MGYRDLALFNDSLLAKQPGDSCIEQILSFTGSSRLGFSFNVHLWKLKIWRQVICFGKVYLKVEKLYKGVQAFGLAMVRRSESSSTVGSLLNIQPWLLLIPYFVHPRFVCYTLKNPKILFSSHWAMRTSTMTWCNLFGHWST